MGSAKVSEFSSMRPWPHIYFINIVTYLGLVETRIREVVRNKFWPEQGAERNFGLLLSYIHLNDLSPPSELTDDLSQSAPAYKNGSLDRPAGWPRTGVE